MRRARQRFVAASMVVGATFLCGAVTTADDLKATPEVTGQSPKNITLDFEGIRLELLAVFFDQVTSMRHVVEGEGEIELDLVVDRPVSVEEAHMMFLSALTQLGCKVRTAGNEVYITKPDRRGSNSTAPADAARSRAAERQRSAEGGLLLRCRRSAELVSI